MFFVSISGDYVVRAYSPLLRSLLYPDAARPGLWGTGKQFVVLQIATEGKHVDEGFG